MPNPSARLAIPLPLGNETVSRQAFLDVYNAIDANAATRAEPEVLAQDLFAQGFVLTGLAASKDSGTGNKLNVTAGVAYVSQAGGGLRRYSLSATSFTTSSPSALYYLDLQPDGTWWWATTHSGQAGYLAVAEAQTDASGNITTVTDKRPLSPGLSPVDAHSVDGAHAGTAANNVLRLDSSGLVPLGNIPATLTGKDADTLDGQHGSYYASAASVGALARLFADANAKDFIVAATGVSVQSDPDAWCGQAVVADASVSGSAAGDVVIFPLSTLRWTEYVAAVRMKTNDATTANLAVLYLEQYVNSAWQTVAQKQVDGAMFTQTGDYEVFYFRGHYSAGTQLRVRVRWNRATSSHVLSVDAVVIVPVGATAAV